MKTQPQSFDAALITAFLLFGSACSSSPTATSKPSAVVSSVPTRACDRYGAEATRKVITGFLDAYNAGASDITERFIAPAGQFMWYGAPGRQYPDDDVSIDRGSLPDYFAAQHSKGDTLQLKVFDFSGITYRETGFANFGYTLIHAVAGGKPHDAPGKGALACGSGKIAVWRIDSW